MLGITFVNEADYDLIQEDDTFNFVDLKDFSAGLLKKTGLITGIPVFALSQNKVYKYGNKRYLLCKASLETVSTSSPKDQGS